MAKRARKSRAQNQRWTQMISCLRLMNFALNNIRLYPPTHTEVMSSVRKLHETLTPMVDEFEDVGFGFMDQLLYIEGAMSLEETAANQMLVDRFSRCHVKFLVFMKGLTVEDIVACFLILNTEAIKPTTEHPGDLLDAKGIRTIHIVEAEVDDTASKAKLSKKKTLLDWYEKAVGTLKSAQDQLRADPAADLKPLYRLVDDMMATIRNKGFEPYMLLPKVGEAADPHLAHGVNVGMLSCILGDMHGLNTGQINTLSVAGFLHDLGRLIIPVEWAKDGNPLSDFEKTVVRQHPTWGFLLLARNKEIPPQIALLAALHHSAGVAQTPEPGRYFPDVFHRILAVADAYDLATIGDKYYWKKHRPDRILRRMLRRRGSLYDPGVTKLLVNAVGYYPVGSLVRLEDGQRALVVRPNPVNSARPKVYLFEAPEPPPPPPDPAAAGEPVEPAPVIADLMELQEDGLGFKRSIASLLDVPPGFDIRSALDRKKEYLLSHSL